MYGEIGPGTDSWRTSPLREDIAIKTRTLKATNRPFRINKAAS